MNQAWLYCLPLGGGMLLVALARGLRRARQARAGGLPERNPGPEQGYAWIAWSLQHMPGWFNEYGLRLGAGIAVALMPKQRNCSRAYLRLALGREPGWGDVWRHFLAFTRYLLLRIEIAHGHEPRVRFAEGHGDELRAWLATEKPALYGTMHLGNSDLVGFFLGHIGGRIHMIRKQVGNSEETERLARRYAPHVSFIWINDWRRLILAMNDALRAGCSLAMQCDRPEYSSKLEAFGFFGEARQFPFTIYHLAIMHERPVVFSFALPDPADPAATVVSVLPMFYPDPHRDRTGNFAAARTHFQAFLDAVEAELRSNPFLWFNFTPMNPPAQPDETAPRRRLRQDAAGSALAPAGAEPLASSQRSRS